MNAGIKRHLTMSSETSDLSRGEWSTSLFIVIKKGEVMKLISRFNVQEGSVDSATIYTVKLDNGETANIRREHFTSQIRMMEPHPEGADENGIINFVKNTYSADFIMPVWERQRIYSYAPVQALCHSMEQAVWMAEREWGNEKHKDSYILFRIRNGKDVLMDFIEFPDEKKETVRTGWVGIEEDYPVSIKQVLNILAETGALTAQKRIRDELKPYRYVKNDVALITMTGLPEEIRCGICTNSCRSDHGCDGACQYDEALYKKILDIVNKRIC